MGKNKLLTAIRTVFVLCVSLVVGLNIYNWNAQSLTGNAVPMPFGFGVATVLSGSMEPALSVGDLLIVKEQDSYGVNDIVVYQSGTMPVVHRIVEIDGDTVTTRGDANNANDEPFSITAIKGTVIADIPFVGRIIWILKEPAVTLVMVIVAVALMEVSFRRNKAEKNEELEKVKSEIRALKEELDKD